MLRSIEKDAVIGVQALQTDSFLVEGVNDFAGYLNSFQIDVQTTSSKRSVKTLSWRAFGKKKFPGYETTLPHPTHCIDHPLPLPYRTRPWRIQFCARNPTELKRTRNFVRWLFTSLEITFFYSWLFCEWDKLLVVHVYVFFTRMIIIIIITKRESVSSKFEIISN